MEIWSYRMTSVYIRGADNIGFYYAHNVEAE